MKRNNIAIALAFILSHYSCNLEQNQNMNNTDPGTAEAKEFKIYSEQFADLRILRYQVPGFESLSLEKKKLLYFLSQAGYSGRDIIYDQNYKHNLLIRKTLECVVHNFQGDRNTTEFRQFMEFTKRVWFSNGIHHHYSSIKFKPQFTADYLTGLITDVGGSSEYPLPVAEGESAEDLANRLNSILFDDNVAAKRVNLNPEGDIVAGSANNYYDEGITAAEVQDFYDKKIDKGDETPVSYGLNSKLTKSKDGLHEKVWKSGGMYGSAIDKIVFWLRKATEVTENDHQRNVFQKLIEYYETGDLLKFDEYSMMWVNDTSSSIDMINGFIEVYGDAAGYRGSYESVVFFKDPEATKRIAAISKEAQWFEDNSSIMEEHKKANVTGISAKVITVVSEAGDASPSTPIGINLPNANWIRANHGSKSVNLGNIVGAYDNAKKGDGMLTEFAFSAEEIELEEKYGALAGNLHTDMHEVIGHASGVINPGVGTPKETLKSYSSTLEEARADLVALYFIYDTKLVDMGLMPSLDLGKAEYNDYISNGLMRQLKRLKPGEHLEEAHMRNRQIIAKWAYEKGKDENVIEKVKKDGKSYFVVRDYDKLRTLFGELLREIQRIKSEGDYEAGKALVENYGVQVDQEVHAEMLERYNKLNIAPYQGFINPKLVAVEENGEIVDVKVEYPTDFTKQMMEYAKEYSFLPVVN